MGRLAGWRGHRTVWENQNARGSLWFTGQTCNRVCWELEPGKFRAQIGCLFLILRTVSNCSDSLRTRANHMSWEIF